MLNRLRKRRPLVASTLAETAAARPRLDLATVDRTEETAALLFVNHTALALGRCR